MIQLFRWIRNHLADVNIWALSEEEVERRLIPAFRRAYDVPCPSEFLACVDGEGWLWVNKRAMSGFPPLHQYWMLFHERMHQLFYTPFVIVNELVAYTAQFLPLVTGLLGVAIGAIFGAAWWGGVVGLAAGVIAIAGIVLLWRARLPTQPPLKVRLESVKAGSRE